MKGTLLYFRESRYQFYEIFKVFIGFSETASRVSEYLCLIRKGLKSRVSKSSKVWGDGVSVSENMRGWVCFSVRFGDLL